MAEQKVIDKAKAWADKEYDELRYSKCEKIHFVFTFRELREMGKQAYIAGHDAASEKLSEELEKARALLEQWLQTTNANGCENYVLSADTADIIKGDL